MNYKLKSIRVLNDITQLKISIKLNITNTAYSLKELGKNEFTLKELKIIKDYLKLTDEQVIDIFFN